MIGSSEGRKRLLFLIAMVGPALVFVTLPPSLPLLAERFGGGAHGREVAQTAQVLTFVGGAVGGLLAGALVAAWGLRRTLIAAAPLYLGGALLAIALVEQALLFAGCAILGFAGVILSSGLSMAMGGSLQGAERMEMLGKQAAVSDVVGIVAGFGAGVLAVALGWRGPFGIYIAFALSAALLLLSSRTGQLTETSRPQRGYRRVISRLWLVYLACLTLAFLIGSIQLQLPFHLAEHGVTSSATRAMVQTCFVLAAACCSLSFGRAIGRFGAMALIAAAGLGATLGFAGFALWTGGLLAACLASASTGLAIGLGIPLLYTYTLQRTETAVQAHSVGLLNVTIFLGSSISGAALGPLVAAKGMATMFLTCAAVAAFGAMVFGALARTAPVMAPAH